MCSRFLTRILSVLGYGHTTVPKQSCTTFIAPTNGQIRLAEKLMLSLADVEFLSAKRNVKNFESIYIDRKHGILDDQTEQILKSAENLIVVCSRDTNRPSSRVAQICACFESRDDNGQLIVVLNAHTSHQMRDTENDGLPLPELFGETDDLRIFPIIDVAEDDWAIDFGTLRIVSLIEGTNSVRRKIRRPILVPLLCVLLPICCCIPLWLGTLSTQHLSIPPKLDSPPSSTEDSSAIDFEEKTPPLYEAKTPPVDVRKERYFASISDIWDFIRSDDLTAAKKLFEEIIGEGQEYAELECEVLRNFFNEKNGKIIEFKHGSKIAAFDSLLFLAGWKDVQAYDQDDFSKKWSYQFNHRNEDLVDMAVSNGGCLAIAIQEHATATTNRRVSRIDLINKSGKLISSTLGDDKRLMSFMKFLGGTETLLIAYGTLSRFEKGREPSPPMDCVFNTNLKDEDFGYAVLVNRNGGQESLMDNFSVIGTPFSLDNTSSLIPFIQPGQKRHQYGLAIFSCPKGTWQVKKFLFNETTHHSTKHLAGQDGLLNDGVSRMELVRQLNENAWTGFALSESGVFDIQVELLADDGLFRCQRFDPRKNFVGWSHNFVVTPLRYARGRSDDAAIAAIRGYGTDVLFPMHPSPLARLSVPNRIGDACFDQKGRINILTKKTNGVAGEISRFYPPTVVREDYRAMFDSVSKNEDFAVAKDFPSQSATSNEIRWRKGLGILVGEFGDTKLEVMPTVDEKAFIVFYDGIAPKKSETKFAFRPAAFERRSNLVWDMTSGDYYWLQSESLYHYNSKTNIARVLVERLPSRVSSPKLDIDQAPILIRGHDRILVDETMFERSSGARICSIPWLDANRISEVFLDFIFSGEESNDRNNPQ